MAGKEYKQKHIIDKFKSSIYGFEKKTIDIQDKFFCLDSGTLFCGSCVRQVDWDNRKRIAYKINTRRLRHC